MPVVKVKQMTNLVAGMKIEISEPVFAGSFRNPKFLGNRQIIGQIVKESYGSKRGQHTFTIDVESAEGMYAEDVLQKKKIRRKGRNVYKNLVRVIDVPDNRKELEKEKSERAKIAKDQKYWSMQKMPQVTPPWATGIYIGNGVVATPSPQFKKGDRVRIYVAKSTEPEMRVLADKIGDELDGVVLFQTGNIVSCDTMHGQINPRTQDIELIMQ